jgi:phosphoribosylaminoimidazolecarboxamide formyltransferase / IMP cyclohydrolase
LTVQEIRKIYRTARPEDFPDSVKLVIGDTTIEYSKVQWKIDGSMRGLRYGTNPHQKAALYSSGSNKTGIGHVEWVKWGKDGPSATNIEDGSHGFRIVDYFGDPAVAIMKHLNPSGVAAGPPGVQLRTVYLAARDADPRAAFGSVVVSNRTVDKETAEAIVRTFVEVVYAPEFEEAAVKIMGEKKDLRLGKVTRPSELDRNIPDLLVLDDGSIILEDPFVTSVRSLSQVKKLAVPTKRTPTIDEYKAMLYAWWTACETRSNAIVFWKKNVSLAIGTGQQDRIGSIESCIEKAHRYSHDLKGSIMASDGFLPKIDNIQAVAKEGVSAIIQPGGSVEDHELIRTCDELGIATVFTGERAFRHF